jgi:excisionase family DNA binding protein
MEIENLNYKQVAELLGVPIGTVYSMVFRQQLPHLRIGPRNVRFVKSEIKSWINSRRILPVDTVKDGTKS